MASVLLLSLLLLSRKLRRVASAFYTISLLNQHNIPLLRTEARGVDVMDY